MRAARALFWLTTSLLVRLLRERMVIRSLLFPPLVLSGTLVGTLVVLALWGGTPTVAATGSTPPAVVAAIEAAGFPVIVHPDPEKAVWDGLFLGGTDGKKLWVRQEDKRTLRVEAAMRGASGAAWVPRPAVHLPVRKDAEVMGVSATRLLATLFTLYGAVFGAGMVARDRDDGTLESELALAVPRWIHGAARWLAGTLLLALHYGLALAVFDAVLTVGDPWVAWRHGVAACGTAVAVGLATIGQGGLKQGFGAPLAIGLVAVAVGLAASLLLPPETSRWMPMTSLGTATGGWVPLGISVLLGVLSVGLFTWRSAGAR